MDLDCNELLEQFSKSVVRIHIYRRVPDQENPEVIRWPFLTVIPGIVTVSGSNFCHIIVCARGFFYDPDEHAYEVIFPDKTGVELNLDTVEESGRLAAFYVPTTGKLVDAVQFSEENVSWRDKVWVFGYNRYSQSVLDDGCVTHLGDDDFAHNVPPTSMTSYGYPVFSMESKLIGISYYDYGVTYAINVKKMTDMLARFFDGMIGKPLMEIIEHIKVLGETTFRASGLGGAL